VTISAITTCTQSERLFPTVTKLPLPFGGWDTLEIGAGQIVQQFNDEGAE